MASPTEIPGAAPVAPLALAAYQDGAVVSRTLLKRAGGTVTLFAFDEGQALSEHTAPFDAVAHVHEGEARVPCTPRGRQECIGDPLELIVVENVDAVRESAIEHRMMMRRKRCRERVGTREAARVRELQPD